MPEVQSTEVAGQQGIVVLNPDGSNIGSEESPVTLATALAGEDIYNDVLKVEQRFTPSGAITSDSLVKAGVGFLHSITISQADAAPTAGTITILDNTVAGSGTQLFSWNLTTAVFIPFTVIIDASFSVGLFADFTTTADVNIFLSYR